MSPQRTCLTLREKACILEELKTGARVTYLSKKYGVSKSTICKIRTQKELILRAVACTYGGPGQRRTLKRSKHPEMEKKVFDWFLSQRDKNMVSGEMIKEKAKSLNSELKENTGEEFTASDGWLQRFKRRYGIGYLNITEEKLPSQQELIDSFKVQLKNIVEELGITSDQLYYADESALYWKNTDVSSQEEIVPGRQQRLPFLACINTNGSHKVKPLVIGTVRSPRAFKNYSLPVDYDFSKSAVMTDFIFENWFHNSFVPQVTSFQKSCGRPVKALLILGNAPSHPATEKLQSDDGQITTMYLPPNLILLDQNVTRIIKLYYRSSLLNNMDNLKNMTLKDVVINLMDAWNRIDPATIAKSWGKILDFDNQEDEDDLPLGVLQGKWKEDLAETQDLQSHIRVDETDAQLDNFDEDSQEVEIKIEDIKVEEFKVEDPEKNSHKKITSDDAINALNTSIQWAEENGLESHYIQTLKEIRETALR